MSQLNPNVFDILLCTEGIIGSRLCKSYLNLAKGEFVKKHGRKANLDDAQELRDLFEAQWVDYYIHRPERERLERVISQPIWNFGKQLKIDVRTSMIYFLRDVKKIDFDKEIRNYCYGTYIMKNGLLAEYIEYVTATQKELPKYRKREYVDFGHLAYNGVTEDF